MILSRKDACNFVDRHYESSLFDINEVKVMSSLDLLTNKRLDLAFKLIYLDSVWLFLNLQVHRFFYRLCLYI